MTRVLVSDSLSEAGLRILQSAEGMEVDYRPGLSESQLAEAIGDYEALVIRSGSKVTARVLEGAHALRVIGRAGIGVDNVDVAAASKRGIVVMNTPTGNAVTTAEHAISLMLSLARKIPQATASMKSGKWEKSKFQGLEVAGKTLGILGLGNIGRIVADRAAGLKMRVIGYDPFLAADRARTLGVEKVELDELWKRSDVITCHTPLTAETRGVIGDAAIAQMKKGVLIVNAARGGIVDEQAVLRGLQSGKLAGAALDVFEREPPDPSHPLLGRDDVIVTPHLGASTDEAQERVALEIAEQIVAFLTTGAIVNAVNALGLTPDQLETVGPYIRLARRLGQFLAQLDPLAVEEIEVVATGEAGDIGVGPITREALAGYLGCFMDSPVNSINAPLVAADRGIRVTEVRRERSRGYASLVSMTARGTAGGLHSASGTLSSSGEPRLATVDGFELDAWMVGRMLVMWNEDRPGVIGNVGTLLGARNINVARMQVGLEPTRRQAISVWNVDSPVPADVLEELRKLPNVSAAITVTL